MVCACVRACVRVWVRACVVCEGDLCDLCECVRSSVRMSVVVCVRLCLRKSTLKVVNGDSGVEDDVTKKVMRALASQGTEGRKTLTREWAEVHSCVL